MVTHCILVHEVLEPAQLNSLLSNYVTIKEPSPDLVSLHLDFVVQPTSGHCPHSSNPSTSLWTFNSIDLLSVSSSFPTTGLACPVANT